MNRRNRKKKISQAISENNQKYEINDEENDKRIEGNENLNDEKKGLEINTKMGNGKEAVEGIVNGNEFEEEKISPKMQKYQDQIIDDLTYTIRKLQERYLDEDKISRKKIKLIKMNYKYYVKVHKNDPDAFMLIKILSSIFLYGVQYENNSFFECMKSLDLSMMKPCYLAATKRNAETIAPDDPELFKTGLFFLSGLLNGLIIDWLKYFKKTNILQKFYSKESLVYHSQFIDTLIVVFSMTRELIFKLEINFKALKEEYIIDPEISRKMQLKKQTISLKKQIGNDKNVNNNKKKNDNIVSSTPLLMDDSEDSDSKNVNNKDTMGNDSGSEQDDDDNEQPKGENKFQSPIINEKAFEYNKNLFPIYKIIVALSDFFEKCQTSKKNYYANENNNKELSKIIRNHFLQEISKFVTFGFQKRKFLTATKNHFWNYLLHASNYFRSSDDPEVKSFLQAIKFFETDPRFSQKKMLKILITN